MKGIKGASFGVRFYRRAGTKTATNDIGHDMADAEIANAVESLDELEQAMSRPRLPQDSEERTTMTDIPPQNTKFVMTRDAGASVKAISPEKTEISARREAQEKALWIAAKNGDCGRIRLLVMEGVDLEARDSQGRTAINIATQYNQQAVIKTLLAAKEMRRMAALGELPKTAFFAKFAKTGTENR